MYASIFCMEKSDKVFEIVADLYRNSSISLGKWMWKNHVQWVANKARKLAEKYHADIEKVYCAALLHDLGDTSFPRGHRDFDSWSENKGKEILLFAGFDSEQTREIIEIIVRPHSCRPGNLPTTKEGKVLATADAMFHIQTNFFPMFLYKHRPETTSSYEEWQEWFDKKIERDFGPKIFFEDEKEEVREDYEALSRVFRNKTFNSDEN